MAYMTFVIENCSLDLLAVDSCGFSQTRESIYFDNSR